MRMDGVFDALGALKYGNAVEVIDEFVTGNPAATVADVRAYASARQARADQVLAEQDARVERAACRHCGVEIVKGNDGAWYHGDVPSWGSRGCRAHSYHRLGGWDDALDRSWKASPS
jgi:hypothetical protein